jgi:histone acetyltransferase (RNA polymerase elongator complex component)
MIIPFFIPHSGCPHQCVFCNQKNITGQTAPIDPSEVPHKIAEYLVTNKMDRPVHLAFYGGSFTGLPLETQRSYLEAALPFIRSGQVTGIRLSTRPDTISRGILDLLHTYHVKTIELGAQSMDDRVLALAGRGHTAADTVNAVDLLREYGFTIGLQVMTGLPGDSPDLFLKTIDRIIALRPDVVRIYPALVIKGTPLEGLFRSGKYAPLSLEEAAMLCRDALLRFERAGIRVIRIGLQATGELNDPGTVLAGPFHPAFRELVESSLLLDAMRALLRQRGEPGRTVTVQVNPKDLSASIGQRRSNIDILKKEFALQKIRIIEGATAQGRRAPILL